MIKTQPQHQPRSVIKVFSALIVLLLATVAANAQWTTPDASQNINNTNTGNVGIGTTTPTSLLEVKKSQNAATTVTVDNPFTTSGNSAYSAFVLKQGGVLRLHIASVNDNHSFLTPGTAQFWNFANAPTVFATNNAERMRINAAGKIGIGTTIVPNAQLHIALPSGEGEALRFHRNGNSAGWGVAQFFALNNSSGGMIDYAQISGVISNNSAGGESGLLAFYTRNSGTLAERVRIASNGDLGVGTTSPGAKLHVVGGIYSSSYIEAFYNTGFRLVVSGPNDPRSTWTYDNGTTTARLTSLANVKTSLGSNGVNDRLVLDLSGNVGIGSTTPSYKLDVQGGSINSSGGLCLAGDCKTAWSQVGGSQWTTSGSTINYATGNVGIATTSPTEKLHVSGNVKVTGNIDVSGNINAKYQDMAEWVESSQQLSAGTVVVLDPVKNNQVVASTQSYDSRVAGVISLQPGIALGERGEGRVLVAATGRVKVKVDASNGPIRIGDLLVTSDKEGVAMKSIPIEFGSARIHRPGTLIGKALEPLAQGTGEILVLLSLQ